MINEFWPELDGPFQEGVMPYVADKYSKETLALILLDYHWNYWRLRRRVEELEKEFVDERNQSVLSEPI